MIATIKQVGDWLVVVNAASTVALVVGAISLGSTWGDMRSVLKSTQEKAESADTRSIVNASDIAVFSERFLASQKILDRVDPLRDKVVAIEGDIRAIAEFVREQKRIRGR